MFKMNYRRMKRKLKSKTCFVALICVLILVYVLYLIRTSDFHQSNKVIISELHLKVFSVRSKASPDLQTRTATEVIKSFSEDGHAIFIVSVIPNIGPPDRDRFIIEKTEEEDPVQITATSGIAATRAFYYYIKNYCSSQISWDGAQYELSYPLPAIQANVTSREKFRFYQNLRTWSYSYAWWTMEQWDHHINWMALNGINLVLAPIQELAWVNVYTKLGLTFHEICQHLSGPGFLTWQRLGNINGWGGPVTMEWIEKSHVLQRKIITRMRALGMLVALPAFAGHVPRALRRLYPQEQYFRVPEWSSFPDGYSNVHFIDPSTKLFKLISKMFLEEIIAEFGTDHIYFSDPEFALKNKNDNSIKPTTAIMYQTLKQIDLNAIWLIHSDMFSGQGSYWKETRISSFLEAVPIGGLLILDLLAEQDPQYMKTHSFRGHAFIWCMHHNFGGNLGLFGSPHRLNKDINATRIHKGVSLVGIGATPEGINQNYVMYDLLYDLAWSNKTLNLDKWLLTYTNSRYGDSFELINDAWKFLWKSVYNYVGTKRIRGNYTYTVRPNLHIKPTHWFNASDVLMAWDCFLREPDAYNQKLYLHDLVDITRQGLQVIADQLYIDIIKAYREKNLNVLRSLSEEFINLLDDIDEILLTNKNYLLGIWLELAKNASTNKIEKKLFERNARYQITLWGPRGEGVDYANKQWAGVVSNFLKPRWATFFRELIAATVKGIPLDAIETSRKILEEVEIPFTKQMNNFTTVPKGDTVDISKRLFRKWTRRSRQLSKVPGDKIKTKIYIDKEF